jgi:hypothetical protein
VSPIAIRRVSAILFLGVALVLAFVVPLHSCPAPVPCLPGIDRPCLLTLKVSLCHPSGVYQAAVLVTGLLVALPLLLWRRRPLTQGAEHARSVR